MKRGTPDHPKTHALAAELNIERYSAVGLLEMLWHFTAHYAKRGDVGRHPDTAIARAIGWNGDAGELIRGLVASRWLDPCSCHRLAVHDWARHADQGVGRSEEVKAQGFIDQTECTSQKLEDSSEQLAKNSLPLPLPLPSLAVALPKPIAPPSADAGSFPSKIAVDLYRKHYPDGTPSGAMFKALRPLVQKHGWVKVAPEMEAYLQGTDIAYHSWPKFAAGFGSWSKPKAVATRGGKLSGQALTDHNKAVIKSYGDKIDAALDERLKS